MHTKLQHRPLYTCRSYAQGRQGLESSIHHMIIVHYLHLLTRINHETRNRYIYTHTKFKNKIPVANNHPSRCCQGILYERYLTSPRAPNQLCFPINTYLFPRMVKKRKRKNYNKLLYMLICTQNKLHKATVSVLPQLNL